MKALSSAFAAASLFSLVKQTNTPRHVSSHASVSSSATVAGNLFRQLQVQGTGLNSVAELPRCPDSHRRAKFDYRVGDKATTFEEFALLVGADYKVTGNSKAKDPAVFGKNPIMVYGENHLSPKVPSLRTPKGVLLLESKEPQYVCMPKHLLHAENFCASIDSPDLAKKTVMSIVYAYEKAKVIVNLIEPNKMEKIMNKVKSGSGQGTAVVAEALEFVSKHVNSAYDSASTQEAKNKLHVARDSFYDAINQSNEVVLAETGARDKFILNPCS